ncbi:acyltransferase [Acidocella aminolytica]|jgi:acetyltransferase-like isoleucine patch superfamily enzyme|uniref:Hexapaptide repeat-containing transferase n=1 Tax=Acidocella aminolytica 101 = DSM 11237 TaxID=1120923 RepID=A0A0D6PDP4_9PROT|nr:acyltransferase [Acidocella aminolytica]GAN79476.1 hexapaptide repeat-containing transferase [Acidocella aminolytica 101 = DSM 11237]GBQ33517.1 acetyltransferase [Acidocella aminolytica 101 = DSM 11237]SHE46799.1 transferase hexapeptide (six repeat-containing protein) [Acidocella aminolytica 101 = DSM 11237]
MALTITDPTGENIIEISDELRGKANGKIILSGRKNYVRIANTTRNLNIYARLGHNCRLQIGANINCQSLGIFQAKDSLVEIGDDFGCNGKGNLYLHEPSAISIGNGCLFADGVMLTTSDMHSIVDISTGTRINPAQDIYLGHRVWLGLNAMVLKGSRIGNGSIVGAHSLVSGKIPDNCSAAGNPAKVLREGITWNSQLL